MNMVGGIWSTSILEDYLIKIFKTKDIRRESLSKKNFAYFMYKLIKLEDSSGYL